MRMTMAAVAVSPAMIARWIGAAPRQRGKAEACRLRQPWRGASRTGLGRMQAVGDDHRNVGRMRGELGLGLGVRSVRGVRTVSPAASACT